MKAYKFKLKTKKRPDVVAKLEQTLDFCRELHNAALQERRDAFRLNGLSLDLYSQKKQLPEIKSLRPDLAAVHSQVLQDVLIRVDKSFNNFFRRVKEGAKKPGCPRFKGRDRYDSFTYPQAGGFSVSGNKLTLSKIGSIRFRQSRPIDGTVKTCTIKREAGDWFVIFTVETASTAPLPKTNRQVGLDVGLEKFAALSNGETIDNPRFYKTAEAEIAAASQNLSRKRIGSTNRRKAKIKLARAHRKIAERRKYFAHCEANKLIDRFDEIHVEKLSIDRMIEEGDFAKSIQDAGWRNFITILSHKAEEAGRKVIYKVAAYTSQTCSRCDYRLPEKIDVSVRTFSCPICHLQIDRDLNAAINILNSTNVIEAKKKQSSYRFRKFGRTGRSRSNPAKESPPTDRLRA